MMVTSPSPRGRGAVGSRSRDAGAGRQPPHKPGGATMPSSTRMALVLLVQGDPVLEASSEEIDLPPGLHRRHPRAHRGC
jgi:hypothetical protein